MEFTVEGLSSSGFRGFVPFTSLDEHRSELSSPGIYAVLRPDSKMHFTISSTGFWHDDKDPAYPLAKLQRKWELSTPVLYIGKAGGLATGTSLWQRLDLFRRYGSGEDTSHRGGRAIWQVPGAANRLVVCWTDTPGVYPECTEEQLLRLFKGKFLMLPFANQKSGTKCQHQPACRWKGHTDEDLIDLGIL
ncbi:hypothetical protein [Pseudarthrobacter sp. B4EP4b]|uniref:hypothetical protein n=1 Tax=Pseudarthrobacter sp. B4EP4b TaxID=2590664 RepID=UPI00114E02E9|nr:hypothetical protein [Pseudarthrobacter sp. B4EP4b]